MKNVIIILIVFTIAGCSSPSKSEVKNNLQLPIINEVPPTKVEGVSTETQPIQPTKVEGIDPQVEFDIWKINLSIETLKGDLQALHNLLGNDEYSKISRFDEGGKCHERYSSVLELLKKSKENLLDSNLSPSIRNLYWRSYKVVIRKELGYALGYDRGLSHEVISSGINYLEEFKANLQGKALESEKSSSSPHSKSTPKFKIQIVGRIN